MSLRIKLKHCSDALKEKWLQDAHDLLTAAGVPQWVEVESMPGNSLPHRLQWYLLRRKDVNEGERHGVCPELNALDAHNATLSGQSKGVKNLGEPGDAI